jgi:hypothetical protein
MRAGERLRERAYSTTSSSLSRHSSTPMLGFRGAFSRRGRGLRGKA